MSIQKLRQAFFPSMNIEVLKGKIIESIVMDDDKSRIQFKISDSEIYAMYHRQDCCESVIVEDVIGDFSDLLNSPILEAEEVSSTEDPEGFTREYQPDSCTWTFYKLGTINGSVTIRWPGESNGYYSESVDFELL